MHAPYRIAAPPEPEGPDQVDAYEALLRARAVRGRRLAAAICGLVAGVSILALAEVPPAARAPTETAEARAALRISMARAAVATAKLRAADEQARFAAAIRRATRGGVTASSGAPCPVTLPEPARTRGGRFPLLVTVSGDSLDFSPSVAALLEDARRAQDHLDQGRFTDGLLWASNLEASASRWTHDVVLVTTLVKHPVRTSTSSFEPGEIRGRAYVYDYGARRVTCVGDVHAKSSPRLEYQFVPGPPAPASLDPSHEAGYSQGVSLSASLDADLERQLQRAIVRPGVLYAVD